MSQPTAFLRATILMAALALSARQAAAQRVLMRLGYRLTSIGARTTVDARVVDNAGRPMASAPLAFRITDPSVAAVTRQGEVTARKPGSTKLWAVSGRDSASALILVEPWPSKFAFSPSVIRFDALGDRQPVKVVASDSAGVPIVGGATKISSCRSVNDRVVTLSPTGEVVSVANGSTYIRCADRGIADSIRVDVQQRAVTAAIVNKQGLRTIKAVGDTFSVRVSARDRLQKDVTDARPTWASLNPAAVSVDPLTGKARAVNGGDAKIIVQVGDIADSTTISVSGSPLFQAQVPVATTTDSTAATKASVVANEIYLFETDTAYISGYITATNDSGTAVPLSRLTVRLVGDTAVATLIDTIRVVAGKKSGQTNLIVRYGSLVDTTFVNVRPKPVAGAIDSSVAAGSGSNFKPPPRYLDSIPVYLATRARADTEIHTDPNIAARRQNLLFTANAIGAIAEHLSKPDSTVTEDRTGVLYGGAATATLYQRVELTGALRVGTLSSAGTVGEDLTITEAEGSIGIFPVRAIGIRLGAMLRNEKTPLASQLWTVPKISLVTRFSFIGDIVNTFAAISLLPKATYSGATQSASGATESASLLSRGGEAGLEFRKSTGKIAFNAGVTYYVEQFKFDNSARVEEFSAIRFRFGLDFGK